LILILGGKTYKNLVSKSKFSPVTLDMVNMGTTFCVGCAELAVMTSSSDLITRGT